MGVSTYDGVSAIVVGSGGSIYLTANNGTNWVKIDFFSTDTISSISQISSTVAMLVGGTSTLFAARTFDGGKTWIKMDNGLPTAAGSTISGSKTVSMVTTSVAYIASYAGVVYKTVNGGYSWDIEFQPVGSNIRLSTLNMFSTVVGVVGDTKSDAFLLNPTPT